MSEDELRGSSPVYSAKDVLLRLDQKMNELDIKLDGVQTSIAILVDQRLNSRVVDLEAWRNSHEGKVMGISAALSALVTVITLGVAILSGILK